MKPEDIRTGKYYYIDYGIRSNIKAKCISKEGNKIMMRFKPNNWIFKQTLPIHSGNVKSEVGESYIDRRRREIKEESIGLQEIENKKVEMQIRAEAKRLYNSADIIIKGKVKRLMPIINPFSVRLIIYDEETAKYRSEDIKKLIYDELEKLIKEGM